MNLYFIILKEIVKKYKNLFMLLFIFFFSIYIYFFINNKINEYQEKYKKIGRQEIINQYKQEKENLINNYNEKIILLNKQNEKNFINNQNILNKELKDLQNKYNNLKSKNIYLKYKNLDEICKINKEDLKDLKF